MFLDFDQHRRSRRVECQEHIPASSLSATRTSPVVDVHSFLASITWLLHIGWSFLPLRMHNCHSRHSICHVCKLKSYPLTTAARDTGTSRHEIHALPPCILIYLLVSLLIINWSLYLCVCSVDTSLLMFPSQNNPLHMVALKNTVLVSFRNNIYILNSGFNLK